MEIRKQNTDRAYQNLVAHGGSIKGSVDLSGIRPFGAPPLAGHAAYAPLYGQERSGTG